MSYIELGNVMFRGEIRGAKGTIHGKLTAKAVNAVDTLNFKDGQITYSVLATYANASVSAASAVLFSTVINIPDPSGSVVEITAYASDIGATVRVDGGNRIATSGGYPTFKFAPFNELISLGQGNHTIDILSSKAGVSAEGYILVRYIRATGSANK